MSNTQPQPINRTLSGDSLGSLPDRMENLNTRPEGVPMDTSADSDGIQTPIIATNCMNKEKTPKETEKPKNAVNVIDYDDDSDDEMDDLDEILGVDNSDLYLGEGEDITRFDSLSGVKISLEQTYEKVDHYMDLAGLFARKPYGYKEPVPERAKGEFEKKQRSVKEWTTRRKGKFNNDIRGMIQREQHYRFQLRKLKKAAADYADQGAYRQFAKMSRSINPSITALEIEQDWQAHQERVKARDSNREKNREKARGNEEITI